MTNNTICLSQQVTTLWPQISHDLEQNGLSACTDSNGLDCDFWLDSIIPKKTEQPVLALCSHHQGPVFIDFLSGKKAHRRQFGGGKNQPLVRAMGQLENGIPKILDATAGMGSDSFVLASMGFQVEMVERSPIIWALLTEALQRAKSQTEKTDSVSEDFKYNQALSKTLNSMQLHCSDSAEFLTKKSPNIDVVYMDPMYPEKKKKAAAKKEMQALQKIVGPDIDSSALLEAALLTAKSRVVVKRPKNAPTINNRFSIQPTTAIHSPNTRYDIYVIKTLQQQLKSV